MAWELLRGEGLFTQQVYPFSRWHSFFPNVVISFVFPNNKSQIESVSLNNECHLSKNQKGYIAPWLNSAPYTTERWDKLKNHLQPAVLRYVILTLIESLVEVEQSRLSAERAGALVMQHHNCMISIEHVLQNVNLKAGQCSRAHIPGQQCIYFVKEAPCMGDNSWYCLWCGCHAATICLSVISWPCRLGVPGRLSHQQTIIIN